MPRLPFWGLSTAATAGLSYTGYHFIYEPRHAAQQGEERRLTQSKQQYQDVIHAHARLRTRLEERQGGPVAAAASSSSSASTSPHGGGGAAWFTNAEKILFFCDVQLVRRLLWTVPHHLTTEHDLRRLFEDLTQWERQHCTDLHFRTTPLTFVQTLRSLACYVVYVVVFRVADPLLGLWEGLAGWQAELRHRTARLVTSALDICVVMAATEQQQQQQLTTTLPQEMPVHYVTLSTAHWIEEVGFWACAKNPLLTQHRTPNKGSAASQDTQGGATLRLLRGSACPSAHSTTTTPPSWHRASWCTPFSSAHVLTVTYAQHWRQVAEEHQVRAARGAVPSASSLRDVAAAEVSVGYPVLTNAAASLLPLATGSTAHPAVRLSPVGVSGLPRLLYVDAAHAVVDMRARPTKGEVYARRQQAQYSRPRSEGERGQEQTSPSETAPSTLATWRADGGIPWWRRVWWGGVYGGPRTSASAPSYTLRYCIGAPCTAADYVAEAAKVNHAAETLSDL